MDGEESELRGLIRALFNLRHCVTSAQEMSMLSVSRMAFTRSILNLSCFQESPMTPLKYTEKI